MKKRFWILLTPLAAGAAGGTYLLLRTKPERFQEIPVKSEHFVLNVAESGTVQPENKISITAPIAGRIDKILADEGAKVKKGQIIAWMSSTDRAALLDSAESQGQAVLQEMIDVYKPTPIISPLAGLIIARNIVVGQTVNLSAVLFDLSDRLVVMADVDETDLGKIYMGQEASIKVDSFPDLPVNAKVIRIAHQSVLKNSINIYPVQLMPEKVPPEFRAGLTASVYFKQLDKENSLVLPAWVAEGREDFTTKLRVKTETGKPELRDVKFGESNGQKIAILEGLRENDVVLVKEQKVLTENKSTSLFGSPARSKGGGRR